MKERPILFSAPMVRAILGDRKTQTRRIVKCQPPADFAGKPVPMDNEDPVYWAFGFHHITPQWLPDTRLWVQENHQIIKGGFHVNTVLYLADGAQRECLIDNREMKLLRGRKRPFAPTLGRFMYRAFSRITLEITDVRVERLQEISWKDAVEEGIDMAPSAARPGSFVYRDYALRRYDPFEWYSSAKDSYRSLWESINGRGSWAANPWVWVIEFRRVAP